MRAVHARDLDLNLLPVLVAVADTGSVTAAAARLYLTQSAVSAALGRLKAALGESIVIRHGRGVVLSERGARLVAEARPHLDAIVQAALLPAGFDPRTSEHTLRLEIRGDRTYETTSSPRFRQRSSVLGAVIRGQPVYVSAPVSGFPDTLPEGGYSQFQNSNRGRRPMLYVASNDGMLHAISDGVTTGSCAADESNATCPNGSWTGRFSR